MKEFWSRYRQIFHEWWSGEVPRHQLPWALLAGLILVITILVLQ